jgi:hypothetical protein
VVPDAGSYSSFSCAQGAYHVDYRQPVQVPEKHDNSNARPRSSLGTSTGPYHLDHESVLEHLQQALQFVIVKF